MRLSLLAILSIQLVWLLPHTSTSKCSEGCLACSGSSDECLICNVHEYYILNQFKGCTRIPIENCAVPSADPGKIACDLCNSGFSLDNATRKCVAVPDIHVDENCEHYHWDDSCFQCKDKFYLDIMTRRCKAIKTEVQNCVTYEDAKTCRSCADGYYYNLGSNTCQQITKIKDCLVYSSVECQACAAGYFQVSNLEGNADLSVDLLQSLVLSNKKESSETLAFYDSNPINRCVKGGLPNCKTHESFKTCKECENGYYLDAEKQCNTNPLRMIAQCKAYNEKGECITCATGYYTDNGRCLAISTVSGCLKYDVTNHYCLECNQATHYQSGQSCGIRIKSANITHCKKLHPTKDQCEECIDSFQLTDSKLFCLPHIPHCKTYIGSTDVTSATHTSSTTQFLLCDICDTHFYRDANQLNCLPQNKPGCVKFTDNTNTCTECAKGFWKNGDSCTARTVTNCKTYNPNSDKCLSCYEEFYFKNELCSPYTKTTCLTFSPTEDHCSTCPLAYFKKDNNCIPYTATNCKTYKAAEDKCDSCFWGFYLDDSCYPITLKNCMVQDKDKNTCDECLPGHYKVNEMCYKHTAQGCKSYVADKNECHECEGKRYKHSTTNECLEYTVSNCKNYNLTADECVDCPLDYFKDIRNNCQPQTIENCATYSTSDVDGKCSTCDDGFELVGGFCYKKKLVGCKTYSGTNCTACFTGFYLNSNKCDKITAKFCAEFKTDANECNKCIPGYKKNSTKCEPSAVPNCSKYKEDLNSEVCIGCKRGYYLTSASGGTCSQLTVTGCIRYTPNSNTCLECRPGLVLDGQLCKLATQNTGCIHIKENDPSKCKSCAKSYYLDTSDFTCKPVPEITNCREYYLNSKLCKYCISGLKPRNDSLGCEPAVNAPNCKIQKYNSDDCALCTPGYYLLSDGSCGIQQIDHCLEYVPNKNQCVKCKKGYLSVSDQCSRFLEKAPNCARIAPNLQDCLICEAGYYVSSNGTCLAQVGEGCRLFAPNSNNCVDCQDHLVLRDGMCHRIMSQPNCYSIDRLTEKCTMCDPKFYNKSGNGFCVKRHVVDSSNQIWDPDCVANWDQDNAKCTLCPQYNASFEFDVHSIPTDTGTFVGCLTSSNTYECTQCKEEFDQRNGSPKCTALTGTSSVCKQMKANSTAGATIDTSAQCAKCRNYETHYLSGGTCTAGGFFNCKSMESSSTICSTCKDNTYHTKSSSGNKTSYECGVVTNATIDTSPFGNTDCLVVKNDISACELCVSNKGGTDCSTSFSHHYLVGLGDDLQIRPKFDISTLAAAATEVDGYTINGVDDETLPTIKDMTSSLQIAQCAKTHSIARIDVKLSWWGDKTAYKPAIGTETDARKKQNVEFFRSYIEIKECIDAFATDKKKLTYKKADNSEETMPIYESDQTNMTASSEKQACMYWELVPTVNFMRCRGCAPNHVPVGMLALEHVDPDGSANKVAITGDFYAKAAIMSCRDLSATGTAEVKESGHDYLEKKYQGLNYGYDSAWNSINMPHSLFVNFDNCKKPNAATDLDAALFVFGRYKATSTTTVNTSNTSDKGSIYPFPFMINSKYQNNIWCLKMDNTQFFSEDLSLNTTYTKNKIHTTTAVENCQIFFFELDETTTTNYIPGQIIKSDSTNIKCLSCRPGYAATITDNYVSACTKIDHCDQTESTNLWMNACAKCSTGFGWNYASGKIEFDNCVAESTYLHCLVIDSTNSKCRMCKDGYSLNFNDKCVSRSRDVACITNGLPVHTLENKITADVSTTDYTNFDYILHLASNMPDHNKIAPYCNACSSGNYLHKKTIGATATDKICLYGTFLRTEYTSKTVLANCAEHQETDNQSCTLCNPNYVVVADHATQLYGATCKLTSEVKYIANCRVIKSVSDPICTACKSGFNLYVPGYSTEPSKRKCFSELISTTNCDNWDDTNNYCRVCKKNFIIDEDNEYKCKSVTGSNGKCIRGGREGQCLECFGANYFPIHYKTTDATKRKQYEYKCVDQGSDKMKSFKGIIFEYDLANNTSQAIINPHAPTDFLYIGDIQPADANLATYLYQKRVNVCLKQDPTVTSNCAKWNQNGFQCSECNYKYYLNTIDNKHNTCIAYNIDNCRVQNDVKNSATATCKICEYGWKLSTNKQACEKVHTDDCLYYDYLNNECFVCKDGYYLNSSFACVAYTEIENCHIRSPYKNDCENCASGYILNSETGKCDRNVVSHCKIPSSTMFGYCERCHDGYQINAGKCVYQDTGNNCNEVNDSGVCTSCFPGYELVQDSCLEEYFKEIPGCVLYDQVGVLCIECDEGMILSGGYCLHHASENCEVLWPGINACKRCKKDYYLKDTSCVRRQVTNCLDYSDDDDKCTGCAPSLLLSNGACVEYSAKHCELYHPDENRCLSCVEGHYLDNFTQLCVQYSVINCKSFDPFRDMCSLCLPDFYRTNKGLCLARTTDKCVKTDPYQDVCLECDKDHYLSDSEHDLTEAPDGTYTGFGTDFKNDCKPYTALNCLEYNPRKNRCMSCPDGFFMNTSNYNCYEGAKLNCKQFNAERNGCLSCPEGTYIDNHMCYEYTAKGCESYSPNKDACLSCKTGQFLNNGNCERRSALNCKEYHPTADMCQSCPDGFFLSNNTCVRHSKKHCAEFSVTADYCLTCESNFFFNNGECLPYSVTCLSYDPNSNSCTACPSEQYLEIRNRLCVDYTVQNCATLNPTANKCVSCDDKYYWENGLCKPYTVNHCEIYHTLFDECVTCKSGFYAQGRDCKEYNVKHCSKRSEVADICLVCEAGHYNFQGFCNPYTAQNCLTYNPMRDACLTCKEGAFFRQSVDKDFFVCEPAKVVNKCSKYNMDKDACEQCEDGYYFEPLKNECIQNPSAVSQCAIYSSATTCKECIAPYYLDVNSNQCLMSELLIDKCIYYSSNSRCGKCEGANLLRPDGQLCERIIEFSCKTYKDNRNCESCEGNSVIQYIRDTDNSKVSGLNGEDLSDRRAICEPSGIENCADAQEGYPLPTCNICQKGYFKSGPSQCQEVIQTIDKCETYFKDGVCAQCEPNHLLNHTKDACEFDLTFLGDNCQEGKFFSEPHCARCKSGYYFDSNGDCTQCSMEGCAVCSANASSSCKLCKNGYYMNSSLNCIASGSKKVAKTANDEDCNETQMTVETADTGLDSEKNILTSDHHSNHQEFQGIFKSWLVFAAIVKLIWF